MTILPLPHFSDANTPFDPPVGARRALAPLEVAAGFMEPMNQTNEAVTSLTEPPEGEDTRGRTGSTERPDGLSTLVPSDGLH